LYSPFLFYRFKKKHHNLEEGAVRNKRIYKQKTHRLLCRDEP